VVVAVDAVAATAVAVEGAVPVVVAVAVSTALSHVKEDAPNNPMLTDAP